MLKKHWKTTEYNYWNIQVSFSNTDLHYRDSQTTPIDVLKIDTHRLHDPAEI